MGSIFFLNLDAPCWTKSGLLPLKVKKHFLTVKKVIHFLTNKERPDFQKNWTLLARNCPKIIFAFDRKIPNSKTKLKNDPLNSKNTFSPTRSVWIEIFILRNYLQNCPRIIYAFDHDFQNSKIEKQLQITKCQKTDPPQICPLIPKQLSEFSKLKNQNVRKLTPLNLPILNTKNHWEGPKGPLRWPKATLRWPKATSPPQELEGGPRSGPNF